MQKRKTLLTILGGPRKNGITAKMLVFAEQAAKEKGYEVSRVNLYEQNIALCTGCRKCFETGECVQKDDAVKIAKLLTPCNTPAPFSWLFGQSRGAIHAVDEVFKTAGMKCGGHFVCTGKKKELPESLKRRFQKLF